MVLSGCTAPERIDTATSNRERTSPDQQITAEATESEVVELAAEMLDTKRKLLDALERKGHQEEGHEVLSILVNDDDDDDDNDDLVLIDDYPEANKKVKFQ